MTIPPDLPTFSDSPFFFDRRNIQSPEQEQGIVQVCATETRAVLADLQSHSKTKVAYYHPKDVGNYHYGVSVGMWCGRAMRRWGRISQGGADARRTVTRGTVRPEYGCSSAPRETTT